MVKEVSDRVVVILIIIAVVAAAVGTFFVYSKAADFSPVVQNSPLVEGGNINEDPDGESGRITLIVRNPLVGGDNG